MLRDPAAYISGLKAPAISAAVIAACDAQDGVKDGVINDPRDCRFDPAVLLCKGPESRSCLTAPQVEFLKSLYTGASGFPGLLPGGEAGSGGWGEWVLGHGLGDGLGFAFLQNYFRYVVYGDPEWNPFRADPDEALHMADDKTAQMLNATDPDLTQFRAHGGKLILYHGWNDPAIPALSTVRYYESVVSKMGQENTASFVRLYMVPGMQHCIGGPGATFIGQLGTPTENGGVYGALEKWVEAGTAPGQLVATKYAGRPSKVVMTRPLCVYPKVAKYKGSGDSTNAANFICASK
jgi:feruloyl esterase